MFLGVWPMYGNITQMLSERKWNNHNLKMISLVRLENPKELIETIGVTKNSAQGQNRIDSLHVNNNKKAERFQS